MRGERKFNYFTTNRYTKNSAKIQLKIKKGWKITHVDGHYNNYKTGKHGRISNIKSKISSGKAIKFPKKWTDMNVFVAMEKGNDVITYNIGFWR